MRKEKDLFGKKQGSKVSGTICLVVAVVIFISAQRMTYVEGTPSEAHNYFWIVCALLIGLYGIVNIVRALRSEKKED